MSVTDDKLLAEVDASNHEVVPTPHCTALIYSPGRSPHCTALNSAQLLLNASHARTRRIYRPARSRDLPHLTGSAHTPYTYLCTRPHRIQPPAVHNHPIVHKWQIVSHLSCAQPKICISSKGDRTYDPLRDRQLPLTTKCCSNSADVFLVVRMSHINPNNHHTPPLLQLGYTAATIFFLMPNLLIASTCIALASPFVRTSAFILCVATYSTRRSPRST